ncbi:hypothetical protein GGI43DRAFT_331347 [Trichoderma evansii]
MMAIKRTILAAALVGGVSALVASKASDIICGEICIDGVDDCGQPFRGCYDPCIESAPVPPPCLAPMITTYYPTPVPTPTPGEIANCSTITVCVDGINSCGIPFGGCIPDCKPWNIFTPPCPADLIDIVPWGPETPGILPLGPAIPTPSIEGPVPAVAPEPTVVPVPTSIPEPTAVPVPTTVPEPTAVPESITGPEQIEVPEEIAALGDIVPWSPEGSQWAWGW